jgi:hypothetical protein
VEKWLVNTVTEFPREPAAFLLEKLLNRSTEPIPSALFVNL